MIQRFVEMGLNLIVVGMITSATVGALMAGTWGLTTALNGGHAAGLAALVASVLPAVVAYQLALNRNDLVDR